MSHFTPIQPDGWAPGRGYNNGMLSPVGGQMLLVAGQIAWDKDQQLVGAGDFVAQFQQALENVIAVVHAAGGTPEHIGRLTIYVTDKHQYIAGAAQVGKVYQNMMGRHYAAMSLVQVADLLEPGALVEIEATAVLPA